MQVLVNKLEQYTNEQWERQSLHRDLRGTENTKAIVVLMLARGVLQAQAKWISSLDVYSLIDTKCKSLAWDLAATLRAVGALS